jgi:two-component sensor histidine kinase/PAS domain-containing protein
MMNESNTQKDLFSDLSLTIDRLYLVAGWELDLDHLIFYLDSLHKDLLLGLGYENIPDSLTLLEYAERYVYPDDVKVVQERYEFALSSKEDTSYTDRFELRLKAVDGKVYYFLINSWLLRPGVIRGQGQNITDLKSAHHLIEDTSASLKSVIENTDDYIFIAKCSGELVAFNTNFRTILSDFYGINIEVGENILKVIPEVLYKQWTPLLFAACEGNKQIKELDIQLNNIWYHIEISVNPIFKNETVSSVSFFIRDITTKWRMSRLDALETSVFEKAFKSKQLKDVVSTLLEGIEILVPEMKCYVTQKKKEVMALEWLSAPGIPPSYLNAVNEITIDDKHGSCGLAAATMEPVLINDIRDHACWDSYRDITLLNGFQACYSFPVISSDGKVLGTLGAYYSDVHEMTDYEMSLMIRSVNIVGILMEKDNMFREIQGQSNQLLEISASVPGVIYIVKMDKYGNRKFMYVSDGVEKYLNISKEMAMESYSNIVASVLEEDKVKFRNALEESIGNKTMMELEFQLSPDVIPEFHCFFLRAVHSFKEDGAVITYGSVFDITQQKKAEGSILQKQMELEALIKCIDDIVFVVDSKDVFVDVYCRDESFLYTDKEVFIGKCVSDIMPAEVISCFSKSRLELKDRDQSSEFFYELDARGNRNYFKARLIKVTDSDLVLVSVKNITQEKDLHFMNEKLRTILDEAGTYGSFGSFELNPKEQSLFCSYHIYEMLGLTSEKKGREFYDFFFAAIHPDDVQIFESRLNDALLNGEGFEMEFRLLHQYGHYIWLRFVAKVTTDPRTNEKVVQGILNNVTRTKLAEISYKKRGSLLEAISLLSLKMMDDDQLDSSIQLLLNKLGESFEVSRIYLFRNAHDQVPGKFMSSQIMEWTDGTVEPQIDNEDMISFDFVENGFMSWVDELSMGRPVLGNVRDFPASVKTVLTAQEIKSILVVPVFVAGEWWGQLGFDECRVERTWLEDDVTLLTAAANLIGNALEKYRLNSAIAGSESRYRNAFNTTTEGMLLLDKSGEIRSCNDAAAALLQMEQEELTQWLTNGSVADDWTWLDADGTVLKSGNHPLLDAVKERKSLSNVTLGLQSTGQPLKWLRFNISVLMDKKKKDETGLLISFADITTEIELKQELATTKQQVRAKVEGLQLRMKRDLGVLSGYMRLQQLYSDDPASAALKSSQSKVNAMVLAQETIYTNGEFTPSQFSHYLEKICRATIANTKTANTTITFAVEGELAGLSESHMITLVSIVNELVGNACTHSFKNQREGLILVGLKTQGDYHVLEMEDDGSVFPESTNKNSSSSLSMAFVKSLVTLLNGAMTIESNKGTKIIVTFPKGKK